MTDNSAVALTAFFGGIVMAMKAVEVVAVFLVLLFAQGCSADSSAIVAADVETAFLGDLKPWIQNECDCQGDTLCDDSDLSRTSDDPLFVCMKMTIEEGDEAFLAAAECYVDGLASESDCSAQQSSCVNEALLCEVPECTNGADIQLFFAAVQLCGS